LADKTSLCGKKFWQGFQLSLKLMKHLTCQSVPCAARNSKLTSKGLPLCALQAASWWYGQLRQSLCNYPTSALLLESEAASGHKVSALLISGWPYSNIWAISNSSRQICASTGAYVASHDLLCTAPLYSCASSIVWQVFSHPAPSWWNPEKYLSLDFWLRESNPRRATRTQVLTARRNCQQIWWQFHRCFV